MCGIAGILAVGDAPPPNDHDLRVMASHLEHRGPDGVGYHRDGPLGLAHTRLSIVDLETGDQPIHNEDRTVWVVFNGEVFNFVELRDELRAAGHRFYTKTDTEVIVHLYEEHGADFVHHLNGQFSIGLWDAAKQRLVLARDRTGIVPLFFAESGGRFFFASEVKALLPFLGTPRLDRVALDQILTFWAPVSPRTPFEGVRELSPGQRMVVEGGTPRIDTYWDWTFPSHEVGSSSDRTFGTMSDGYLHGSEDQLAGELDELLSDAARIRLRADVPVGAYLSGGLDSSALVSLILRQGHADLRTFSLGFESENLDESPFQAMVVDHLGTDHRQVACSRDDVARYFESTIWSTETPILRTAPTPMKLLSGLVRESGYKVVMTGEGADEVLGGYDIFKEAKVRRFWSRQPDSAWRPRLLQRLYPYLELSSVAAQRYVQEFFGMGLDRPDWVLFSHLPRWDTAAKAKLFYSDAMRAELTDSAMDVIEATMPAEAGGWHPFNRGAYLEAKSLMGGYLLSSQGDRMLMANSVEGRFPFLDHRVIEMANRLDPRLKMKVLREKHLLKIAMESHLPREVIQRTKQPYRAPDLEAFVGPDRPTPDYVNYLLSPETVSRYGYFDPAKVELLMRKARTGSATSIRDNQTFVGILSTQLWHYLFIEGYTSNFGYPS